MATESATGPFTAASSTVSCDGAQADIRNIRVSDECDVKAYSSSSTGGYEKNLKGVIRNTITFDMYISQSNDNLQFGVGDLVDIVATRFNGEARISSIDAEYPVEGNDLVTASVTAIANGAVT